VAHNKVNRNRFLIDPGTSTSEIKGERTVSPETQALARLAVQGDIAATSPSMGRRQSQDRCLHEATRASISSKVHPPLHCARRQPPPWARARISRQVPPASSACVADRLQGHVLTGVCALKIDLDQSNHKEDVNHPLKKDSELFKHKEDIVKEYELRSIRLPRALDISCPI
jgi:hypothetical protein